MVYFEKPVEERNRMFCDNVASKTIGMDYNQNNCHRVYLPSLENGIDAKEYLSRYIEREFPTSDGNAVYSIPRSFRRCGEKQASLAEEVVFNRLRGLEASSSLQGLWMMFVHNVSYAGHSHKRVGKLMIREHDFVVFVRYQEKFYVVLIEVKSTHDNNTQIPEISITSDAKVIKNNKRSAMHQLRDHFEILQTMLTASSTKCVQQYIFWPYLGALTKDPRHTVIKRWKEDENLHVFENTLASQSLFDEWFIDNVLNKGVSIKEECFVKLVNRYLLLSCGFFVNEIREDLLGLLTQEQLELLNSTICQDGRPMVVHGAAGTGKSLLILRKLEKLYETGRLNSENRALYICYWPGIRCDLEQKLKQLGLDKYIDTARFYISQTGFLQRNDKTKYKHIFMDEAEVSCMVFEDIILQKLYSVIYERYHNGNCDIPDCVYDPSDFNKNHNCANWGELWFLVDTNQASLFLPKHSPKLLKTPKVVLTKVMRTTGYIYNVFKQFYNEPIPNLPTSILAKLNIPDIHLGHHIMGPPIYWVDSKLHNNGLIKVIIDLCATKGFRPNDICVLPFLINDKYISKSINEEIDKHFVENGYRPKCVDNVENFLCNKEINEFLIAWGLRVKGLEFKVVIIVMDDGDFDVKDSEDRKKIYIMTSRCTCLLIFVSPREYMDQIAHSEVNEYCFGLEL